MELSKPQLIASPPSWFGGVNGKPPGGAVGNRGFDVGRSFKPVTRGAVATEGAVVFVNCVDNPNEPNWSNVLNRPAPTRSYTMPKPPRMEVLLPFPKSAPGRPEEAFGEYANATRGPKFL